MGPPSGAGGVIECEPDAQIHRMASPPWIVLVEVPLAGIEEDDVRCTLRSRCDVDGTLCAALGVGVRPVGVASADGPVMV